MRTFPIHLPLQSFLLSSLRMINLNNSKYINSSLPSQRKQFLPISTRSLLFLPIRSRLLLLFLPINTSPRLLNLQPFLPTIPICSRECIIHQAFSLLTSLNIRWCTNKCILKCSIQCSTCSKCSTWIPWIQCSPCNLMHSSCNRSLDCTILLSTHRWIICGNSPQPIHFFQISRLQCLQQWVTLHSIRSWIKLFSVIFICSDDSFSYFFQCHGTIERWNEEGRKNRRSEGDTARKRLRTHSGIHLFILADRCDRWLFYSNN